MTRSRNRLWLLLAMLCIGGPLCAQPAPNMSFFVTSSGNGAGAGNLAGLDGADARCQSLAMVAGAGSLTWHAYLSTTPHPGFGGELVHARDRIGTGPWFNYAGVEIASDLDDLHASPPTAAQILTETGVPPPFNDHDILTGSEADGTAWEEFPGNPAAPPPNCFNWTRNDEDAYGYVGHSDWFDAQSWSSQHPVQCHPAGLASTGGSGRVYCFAVGGSSNLIFGNGFE